MSESFFDRRGGHLFGSIETQLVRRLDMTEVSMQRAVNAYRNGLALPDVHIADRDEKFVPRVVGEDGQELTVERRAQLMRDAGVKPMFDEEGHETAEHYVSAFESVIGQERFGESAERNRRGMRIVTARELVLELDIDDKKAAAAVLGGTYVPNCIKGEPDAE